MQIRVALMPQLAGDVSQAVCVVVDVLRATTVIATLFSRGCPRVYVAGSHEAARTFARAKGYVLCGETGGHKVEDFDFGNSPVEFVRQNFTNRPVTLSTTNGTKATVTVASARTVYLGAAINRMAVAKAAWETATESGADIVVVCSGTDDAFTLEDASVAGMYVEAITAQAGAWEMPEQDDAARFCRRFWQTEPNLLRGWMEGFHARRLADLGFGDDLGYCAQSDIFPYVPILVREGEEDSVEAPVLIVPSA